jgi:predicted HD superfamily hydrolase involved in NAD metabolism
MREQVIGWLKQKVSPARLSHILGVEQMSQELADSHNCDRTLAGVAGLMHDLAKFFPPDKLLKMAVKYTIELDEITRQHPHLIHADASAIIAREEFGVDNQFILNAISNHTLGTPEMDKISCIVFIADKLEPSRGNTPELENMRKVSHQHLYRGLVKTCDYSLHHLMQTSRPIHPRTILTRNWALSLSQIA